VINRRTDASFGKTRGHAGPSFEFLVDAFHRVGSPQLALMGDGEGEDGEPLGKVLLHPVREFWSGLGVAGTGLLEPQLGGGTVGRVENAPDVLGHFGAQVHPGDVGLGVLLEMKLTALPGDRGEDGGAGGTQAGVVVADNMGDALKATLLEAREELAPVDLGFAQCDADAENGAFAEFIHSQGDEDGAIDQTPAMAHLFVSGIDDEIGERPQWPVAPGLKFNIELGGAFTDLRRTDRAAAEFRRVFESMTSGGE